MHIYTLLTLIAISYINISGVNCMTTINSASPAEMTILIDMMSMSFSQTVLIISSMIIIYSTSYMKSEMMKKRFILILVMFVMSMLVLLYSPNMFSLMVGWDGLGLSSFCLVIFYQNYSSMGSGLITVFSNRIGDCFMIIAICMTMNMNNMKKSSLSMKIMSILIMMAAFTKSAQMPFSAWLPAAMAAPTPVSSLVHSSTLVTAGIFLMSRFNSILKFNMVKETILTSSMTTSMVAGMTAWKESDSKKIVAMSTLSQLGIMAFALALESWKLAFFHMSTHAMFKALLFMTTGYNMQSNFGSQSKSNMVMPKSKISIMMNTANLALMGAPFLSGFYSKDLIIESGSTKELSLYMMTIFMVVCVMTSVYTFILIESIKNNSKIMFLNKEEKKEPMMEMSSSTMYFLALTTGMVISEIIQNQLSKSSLFTKKLGIMFILTGLMFKNLKSKEKSLIFSKMMMTAPISKETTAASNEISKKMSKLDNTLLTSSTLGVIYKEVSMMEKSKKMNTKMMLMNLTLIMFIIIILLK